MGAEGRQRVGSARVPALDGLRGVAVFAVLAFHGGLSVATGGFLGVSAFFTLSGFLITTLLLLEWEGRGRIALGHFWARRARRLLPAALVALLGIAAYGAFVATGHEATRIGGDGISAMFYVANWRFVIGDQSYAALFSSPSPVQHFWSLAIEEQFYLVFPLIAIGALTLTHHRVGFRRVLYVLVAVSLALGWILWSPGHDPSRVYYGTDTRAAEVLVGAVLATVIAGRRRRSRVRGRRIAKHIAGVAALLALVTLWIVADQSDGWLYHGGLGLHAVLTAFVIAAAVQPGPVAWVLERRPLRALGLISYGVYLFHWPIFLWLDEARVGVGGVALFLLRSAVTVAVAVVSYRFVEQPIRTGRAVVGRRPRWLVPAAAAGVGALLLATSAAAVEPVTFSAVNRPAPSHASSAASSASSASASAVAASPAASAGLPLTGPPPATTDGRVHRIMIVGDSVALTMGRGLERWGLGNGVEVLNLGRPFCPIARGGRVAASFGNAVDHCGDWPTNWAEQEAAFRPDVVVVLTTVWDVSKRQRDEWGPEYIGPGDPRFDRFVRSEWKTAVNLLGATGARVAWLRSPCTPPYEFDEELRYANRHYLGAVREAGAHVVDLFGFLCAGGEYHDGLQGVAPLRPDGLHFSDAGADLVARWLGPILTTPADAAATRGSVAPELAAPLHR